MHKIKWLLGLAIVAGLLIATCPLLAQGQGQSKKDKSAAEHKADKKSQDHKGQQSQPGEGQVEKGKHDKERPAGWNKGKKEGWDREVPPGWENWDEAKKSRWQGDLQQAKDRVRAKGKSGAKRNKAEIDSACVALEQGAVAGVPIEEVDRVVEKGLEKGLKGKELQATTRAMAHGAQQGVETASIAAFVHQKLDEGLRGDALSTQIEAEIERRHADKVTAEESAVKATEEALEKEKVANAKKWWEFWK
ncbi:hypothetical protein GX408_02465 [bacterium]|nr:hypothetical protein [bacterium]